MRRSLSTLLLMAILGFAVPSLLTDLECIVGRPHCDSCTQEAVVDCSADSLAAVATPALAAPPMTAPRALEPPPAPPPVQVVWEHTWPRAPRDGPPPPSNGLRAPPL